MQLSDLVVCVSTSSRVLNGKRQGLTISTKLLIDFLATRVKFLIAIDHPFLQDPDTSPLMEIYSKGVLQSKSRLALPRALNLGKRYYSFPFKMQLYYLFKVIDLVSSFIFVLRSRKVVDIYVGVEAINVMAGLLLRKLGLVRFVVYYAYDYSPRRFPSSRANLVFLRLDRFCAVNADIVWNAMGEIEPTRRKVWGDRVLGRQVPVSGWTVPPPDRRNFRPRKEHSIAYLGGLEPLFGVQIVIAALPAVLKVVPDVEFHVIGQYQGNSFAQQFLTRLVEDLGVKERVTFHGFLTDDEATKILDHCRVGVATYIHFATKTRLEYLDSSKGRYYAFHGVPVVFSEAIPPFAELVKKFHAGLVVSPDVDSVARAICSLLTDNQLYRECVEGCYSLVDDSSSERVYERAFAQLLQ